MSEIFNVEFTSMSGKDLKGRGVLHILTGVHLAGFDTGLTGWSQVLGHHCFLKGPTDDLTQDFLTHTLPQNAASSPASGTLPGRKPGSLTLLEPPPCRSLQSTAVVYSARPARQPLSDALIQRLFLLRPSWSCSRNPKNIEPVGYALPLLFAPRLVAVHTARIHLEQDGVYWCGRRDLNSHVIRHWNLNPARLPIPPLPHVNPGNSHSSGHTNEARDVVTKGVSFQRLRLEAAETSRYGSLTDAPPMRAP